MMQYDAVIIGGGPAGSTCAWALCKAGWNVAVLDKSSFPRDKVCAGWVTPAVMQTLSVDPVEYQRTQTLQPIQRFRTGLIGGKAITTTYPETVSYGIRRCEFDDYLLRRSGARLLLGEGLKQLQRDAGGWRVNGELRTPLVIGAGGHFCPVARHLGARLGSNEPVVSAKEVEVRLNPRQVEACRVQGDQPELYFCKDLRGYGWAFRKGDYLNIGLGRDDNRNLSEHVSEFVLFLKETGRIPRDVAERFKGHAYLLYSKPVPRRLISDGMLLIGDAAGLAYPQSGEGIRTAVESALLATETIHGVTGEFSQHNLATYPQRLQDRFGKRASTTSLFSYVPAPLKTILAEQLLANHWLVRHIILNGWFLHKRQLPLDPGFEQVAC